MYIHLMCVSLVANITIADENVLYFSNWCVCVCVCVCVCRGGVPALFSLPTCSASHPSPASIAGLSILYVDVFLITPR